MPDTAIAAARLVAEAVSRRALQYTTERQLRDAVHALLASQGFDAKREARLDARDRVDFLIGEVAVELKVDGTADALERQITRYAGHDEVASIVVITNRARHRGMPPEINGKPVLVVWLAGAF